jgi:enterochelin esterase-like enzyme
MTFVTLATLGWIVGWAGAALAQSLRPGLIQVGQAIREAARERRLDSRLIRRPLAAGLVLILLMVTLPVFGDMVNYTPDSRMLHGGAPPAGLIPGDQSAAPSTVADLPSASASTGTATAAPSARRSPSPVPADRPWLAWRPSGSGAVNLEHLPAPWRGGSTTAGVGIYTPPGYEPGGGRRYPVLYEAPNTYAAWDAAVNVHVILDTLIDDGSIPAMIVVFVDAQGTVVSYVDTHYATIKAADGRGIIGFSQGGYCAAVLALRHPSVFGTSIPISGYFRAGQGDSTSALPFGSSAPALKAASPIDIAPTLSAAVRAALFFVLISSPSQPFYGAAATAFERVIDTNGYTYMVQNAKVPHGWVQVREQLPGALEAWGAHLAVSGGL